MNIKEEDILEALGPNPLMKKEYFNCANINSFNQKMKAKKDAVSTTVLHRKIQNYERQIEKYEKDISELK